MRSISILILAFVICSCAGKPTTGIMAAHWTPPIGAPGSEQMITIAWDSNRASEGRLTFTLGPGGERFVGSYLLIEKTRVRTDVEPFYERWQTPGYAEMGPTAGTPHAQATTTVATFAEQYDGRVVAGLDGDGSHAARCHFRLADTERGLVAGGFGDCDVTDGSRLRVSF
jgi:hypothetical protein